MNTHLPSFAARPISWAVLLFGLALINGCRKPEDELGLDLLDPSDTLGLTRTDTLTIVSWSKPQDAVQTNVNAYALFGSYVDPDFGKLTTGFATQVRLSSNNVGPANANWVCDSLVLSLIYHGTAPIHGDHDAQTIAVYRLNERLSSDSTYHNDRPVGFDAQNLVANAPLTLTPVTDDGPIIGGDSLPAQLRIPLDPAVGAEFLARFGGTEMSDNTNFLEYFNGLYVVPENPGQGPGDGGVWTFNMINGNSKLTLYYHDSTVGTPLNFSFTLGSSVRYTTAVFDRTGTPAQAALDDTASGQQRLYLQPLGGIRSEIRIPHLHRYIGTPYQAIAKAELVMPVADHDEAYPPPTQLFAYRKSDTGTDLFIPDQVVTSTSFSGAAYDAEAQEYRMNITRYVQNVLNGNYENTGLGLALLNISSLTPFAVNRAVLNGPDHPDRPMRLVVTFTTY